MIPELSGASKGRLMASNLSSSTAKQGECRDVRKQSIHLLPKDVDDEEANSAATSVRRNIVQTMVDEVSRNSIARALLALVSVETTRVLRLHCGFMPPHRHGVATSKRAGSLDSGGLGADVLWLCQPFFRVSAASTTSSLGRGHQSIARSSERKLLAELLGCAKQSGCHGQRHLLDLCLHQAGFR